MPSSDNVLPYLSIDMFSSSLNLICYRFISDSAERDPDLSPDNKGSVQEAVQLCNKSSECDAALWEEEVLLALRFHGDRLNEDPNLNSLIAKVCVQHTKESFMKVCERIFVDPNCNWGRVVAVFYFAYRLIKKAVCTTMDEHEGIDLIRHIMSWAMDCLYQYVIRWIVQKGGWAKIKECIETSGAYAVSLSAAVILTLMFAWWKRQ